jgi:predicted transcriptional regulator
MKYRSRTDIVALLLRAANQGASKTKLMYSAYLSYSQVTDYLKFLQERNLLDFDAEKSIYTLTEVGLQLLHSCEQINELLGGAQTPDGRKVEEEKRSIVRG